MTALDAAPSICPDLVPWQIAVMLVGIGLLKPQHVAAHAVEEVGGVVAFTEQRAQQLVPIYLVTMNVGCPHTADFDTLPAGFGELSNPFGRYVVVPAFIGASMLIRRHDVLGTGRKHASEGRLQIA